MGINCDVVMPPLAAGTAVNYTLTGLRNQMRSADAKCQKYRRGMAMPSLSLKKPRSRVPTVLSGNSLLSRRVVIPAGYRAVHERM
jgi:hypothetical protein